VIGSGQLFSGDLSTGETPATLQGESISAEVNEQIVFNNSAGVAAVNIRATNAVVHVIDAVLVPPSIATDLSAVLGTILQGPYFSPAHIVLIAAIKRADLLGVLTNTANNFTLFAPDNDAFVALLSNLGLAALEDIPLATLEAVLLYHVVGGTVRSTDLPTTTIFSAPVETAGGTNFFLSNRGNGAGVFINGTVSVVATDLFEANGIVHLIDAVIVPPANNVVEIAQSVQGEFTALEAALLRTVGAEVDLVAALTEEGNFTVFAPTDAAFQALLDSNDDWNSVDDIDLAVLTQVLLHHVVAAGDGLVFSVDLFNGEATTLNGDNITVSASDLTITSGAGVEAALVTSLVNILGNNGVIHVIDSVLIP
jgi:transforming growth factor-beta-induced protein